jgi:hypothetical protein
MATRSANQGLAAVAEEEKRMPLAALAILEAILSDVSVGFMRGEK